MLAFSPTVVAKQDVQPERLGDVLPSAAVFGDGWTTIGDAFEPKAIADEPILAARGRQYMSDRGDRALVDVVLPEETLHDAREAWEIMTGWIDPVEQHTYDDDSLTQRELEDLDPPLGCVDAERGAGTSYIDANHVGATLCDTGDGYYMYARVSGTIRNNGVRYDYHTASDMIVSAMLGYGPLAPRPATPAA